MTPTILQITATLIFAIAIIHTFTVSYFQKLAKQHPEGSLQENLFHLLGEVEVVFGLWSAVYFVAFGVLEGFPSAIENISRRNFTEPMFVFVIMVVCASLPLLNLATQIIQLISRLIPLPQAFAFFITVMIVGPLLGSLITEPAAMTVTALILWNNFFSQSVSTSMKYSILGALFVNISVGGTLTPYAAPPILMVAGQWDWDLAFMLTHFGYKGVLTCILSTAFVAFLHRKELAKITKLAPLQQKKIPAWMTITHLLFLVLIVLAAHHPVMFIGLFLFFLGLVAVTNEYQSELQLRSGLLVGFFLGGLVVLGEPQRWWVEPLIQSLNSKSLYLGAIGLTSIVDNAALTFLGAQVPNLAEELKYFLVAGSVVGGGLTVIANAPNPIGFGILNPAFGAEGIKPLKLFQAALIPTAIAAICFFI